MRRESREEQLRKAKRAQRARERSRGLTHLQLTLPAPLAEKLQRAMKEPEFLAILERTVDDAVVRISDYPALRELAWNLHVDLLGAREAFALYERNWRFVDQARLTRAERDLIDRLAKRFGAGVIHA